MNRNSFGNAAQAVGTSTRRVLGGVLLGMFIATRALSSQGFTPFEVSMLKLRDDVQNLKQELGELRRLLEGNESE